MKRINPTSSLHITCNIEQDQSSRTTPVPVLVKFYRGLALPPAEDTSAYPLVCQRFSELIGHVLAAPKKSINFGRLPSSARASKWPQPVRRRRTDQEVTFDCRSCRAVSSSFRSFSSSNPTPTPPYSRPSCSPYSAAKPATIGAKMPFSLQRFQPQKSVL